MEKRGWKREDGKERIEKRGWKGQEEGSRAGGSWKWMQKELEKKKRLAEDNRMLLLNTQRKDAMRSAAVTIHVGYSYCSRRHSFLDQVHCSLRRRA